MSSPSYSAPTPESMNCPRCSTAGTGRFCTECGAPLNDAPCAGCGEHLTPGSKFCHRCGVAAGVGSVAGVGAAAKPSSPSRVAGLGSTLPWAVAGIAFLTLFAMLAGKGFNARTGSAVDAPSNALPNPVVDNGGMGSAGDPTAAPFAAAAGGSIRAPDISKMSPSELADRLFNRIMILNDQGKSDSVQFFAPMAVQAYQMVEQAQGHSLEADQRYDVGRIAEVAGALPMAKAQADTILQQQPDHLLGLLLAAHVAKESGNTPAQSEYSSRFLKVKGAELAKNLPEYQRHRREIDAGV
ncbi:MAG: zinc ribbon domain-containing protein [Gemmatimonadaceae bacterium]